MQGLQEASPRSVMRWREAGAISRIVASITKPARSDG
jgi:hypothetical protein